MPDIDDHVVSDGNDDIDSDQYVDGSTLKTLYGAGA
jgi:hypothetical protein